MLPMTPLALRNLALGVARRGLLSLAHSCVVGWRVFPPLAALLDVEGCVCCTAPKCSRPCSPNRRHASVHAYVLAAGLLFTFAVSQLDPVRRRRSLALRGTALLAAGAAHAVLAKTLYAAPPPGNAFAPADLHTGAPAMYYGGIW